MNAILIFIAIVVISSAIGAVSRWLKNQQQEEQARLARQRSGERAAKADTGVDTIDRYVAEIERLRQRKANAQGGAAEPPRPARVMNPPVVPPARRPRNPDGGPPVVRPVVKQQGRPRRVEELPVAPVIAPTPSPVVPVIVTPGESLFPQAAELAPSPIGPMTVGRGGGAARPEVARAKLTAVPPFLALLSSRQGLATAMAVSVVLGEPRCKRHHG